MVSPRRAMDVNMGRIVRKENEGINNGSFDDNRGEVASDHLLDAGHVPDEKITIKQSFRQEVLDKEAHIFIDDIAIPNCLDDLKMTSHFGRYRSSD
ncbi:uncharacterized protein Dyak_GE27466 [Drosophila yakuba]|uniref:Uncharacterized protein n=1 Tax=Drosophila yakuba TaxID=7245 RepID=A0A0R1E6X0_DROYA|nr:uncharacterized protein Dyak_GE27466 [Drosophila yakuba]